MTEEKQKIPSWQWALIFLFSLYAAWIYYPALSLPPSLVDDYVKLHNLDRVINDYRSGGFSEVVRNDISVVNRTYNLGFYLLTALNYRLTGGQPFHWLKLAELAAVALLLFGLVRRALGSTSVATLAGLFSVCLFLIADVPEAIDLHGLRMNWFRLFATDADGLLFLAIHAYCVFGMLRSSRRWSAVAYAAVAGLAGFLATTMKIPYIALVAAPLGAVACGALALKQKRLASYSAVLAAAIFLAFALFYLVMRKIATAAGSSGGDAYGTGYSFAPADVWAGFMYYVENFWNMFGPLFPAIIVLTIAAFKYHWHRRFAGSSQPLLLLTYLFVFTLVATAMYSPWLHRLPRYMLPAFFGWCALAGICFHLITTLFVTRTYSWYIAAGAVVVGMTATLMPPVYLIVLLLLVAAAYVVLKRGSILFIAAGVGIAGFLYILLTSPLHRAAINNYYIGREFANWQATLQILKQSAEQNNILFAGNVADEQIGSMVGHIRRFGIETDINATTENEPESATSQTVYLVHRNMSPPEEADSLSSHPIIAEYSIPKTSFKVPLKFWETRGRLFSRVEGEALFYNVWQSDYVWRVYAAGTP